LFLFRNQLFSQSISPWSKLLKILLTH
jgi:hypothetical protein